MATENEVKVEYLDDKGDIVFFRHYNYANPKNIGTELSVIADLESFHVDNKPFFKVDCYWRPKGHNGWYKQWTLTVH